MDEKTLFRMSKTSPNFHLSVIDEWFSEKIEVSVLPDDYYIAGMLNKEKYTTEFQVFNEPRHTFIRRKLENRRDEIKLKPIIQRHMQNYLRDEKDSNEQLFKKYRIERIEIYQIILCKDRHLPGKGKERGLYEDLETYKRVLEKLVPDEDTPEIKPKDRHPKEHHFTTPEAYEVFKFLADEYHDERFVKWSVIFMFMKNMGIETHLSGRKYLQWIKEYYQPKMKSENVQTGTDEAHEIITTVFSRYKKPT